MWRLLFILLFLFPTLSWAEPHIVFDTEHTDLGELRSGTPLEAVFAFGNTGSDELVVGKVRAFT